MGELTGDATEGNSTSMIDLGYLAYVEKCPKIIRIFPGLDIPSGR